jgi:hypothetical protein
MTIIVLVISTFMNGVLANSRSHFMQATEPERAGLRQEMGKGIGEIFQTDRHFSIFVNFFRRNRSVCQGEDDRTNNSAI